MLDVLKSFIKNLFTAKLSCKFLAVTRETKLTLSIAVNPKSKLALERGTNLINRNTRAC